MVEKAEEAPGGNIEIVLDTPAGISPGELPTFGGLEIVTGEVRVAPGEFPANGWGEIWVRRRPKGPYDRAACSDFPAIHLTKALDDGAESFPFAMQLPNRPGGRSGWSVAARLRNYLGDHGPTVARPIVLLPPAPVRGLMACLFTLGDFVLISETAQEEIIPEGALCRILYLFAPPPEWTGQIEGIRLEVTEILLPPNGDSLKGRLVIDLKERNWTDYLRDKCRWVRRPFDFPATVLAVCAPGGGGNLHTPATVMPPYPQLMDTVRDLLAPFVK